MRPWNSPGSPSQPPNLPVTAEVQALLDASTSTTTDAPRVVTDADMPYTLEDGYKTFVMEVTAATPLADRRVIVPAARTTPASFHTGPGAVATFLSSPSAISGPTTLTDGTPKDVIPYSGGLLSVDYESSGTPVPTSIVANTTISSAGVYFLRGGARVAVTLDLAILADGSQVTIKADTAAGDIGTSTGVLDGITGTYPVGPPTTVRFVVDGGSAFVL